MGKPRMIILIRHAQSEGNKNRDIHQTIPDHRVKLTPEGQVQAQDAGRRLRSMLRADDTLHFFTSPYRRTRETTEGILSTLTSDEPSPSPFKRHSIKVYEEPRLREQDFGNFQPCSAEMERMWQERADYGHFFYRIPNGESAADAYDRVSGFNESLWRQFGEDDCASVCVLVTHGLMSRVFLMKWYHFSVEYFEDLRNVNHCEFLIMRKQPDSGKYILENNLRTWSELRRDRETIKEKEKERSSEKSSELSASPVPIRKKWGGCPNGCSHVNNYSKKQNPMHAMQSTTTKDDPPATSQPARRPTHRRWQSSSEDEDDPRGRTGPPRLLNIPANLDEAIWNVDGVISTNGTVSTFSSRLDKRHSNGIKSSDPVQGLRAGRDFGGSASGHTSQAESDTEVSSSGEPPSSRQSRGVPILKKRLTRTESYHEESGMGRGAKADALGDQSDNGVDEEEQDLDLEQDGEKHERSVQGSVF